MKTKILFTLVVMTGVIFGQYNPDNHVVTVSMYYMNDMDEVEDGSWTKMGELMEKESTIMNRLDKDMISSLVLGHRWSGSLNEVVHIREWKSIADADKSTVGSGDMRKKGWPNEEKRKAFFKDYGKYWQSKHTDLAVMEMVTSRVKRNKKKITENSVVTVIEYYLKPMSQVEGGSIEEREALFDEYFKKVVMKNDKIISRRELKHYWSGSLGGGKIPVHNVTEYANMVDADNNSLSKEAIEKAWPVEEERKAFFQKRNKYIAWGHKDIAVHTNWVKLAKR
ncbi:MAG: hypothetical protein ISR89_06090 [Candidatus Marinimicrobia bacterium]|nr:hypothetical protein [Candidatus Neomarinimicrobiota bacterium]MBL7030716.1 hypothetical protein [Candidatus Neomarinimicrobiota bacterium]